jgi:muramoyltetrapeptide carboxypeptidase
MKPLKPKRLQKGDTVGIIAPASPTDHEKLEQALPFLEELGLEFKLGNHLFEKNGYLAGSDQERLEDLQTMFLDDEVSAIFCARGGYGTARIASKIDYDLIRTHPKIFWGYSDITFLHHAFYKKTGLVTFHGPMLSSDLASDEVDPLTKQRFCQLFQPQEFVYDENVSPLQSMTCGKAKGPLVGGNLTLLVSSLGTEFELDTKDKLLLLEDVDEEPRAIDRMLNQLYMSGKLTDAAGILVGDFHHCEPMRDSSLSLEEVISHYMKLANKPTLSGFKIGHCMPHIAVPLGALAFLDSDQKTVTFASGVE